MKVKVTTVGVLEHSLPAGEEVIEAEGLTVHDLMDALVDRHGPRAAKELLVAGGLRDGLSLLLNGRNVLSLPDRIHTPLQDGDEVVITVLVTGG